MIKFGSIVVVSYRQSSNMRILIFLAKKEEEKRNGIPCKYVGLS